MKFDLKKTISDILVKYSRFGQILANIDFIEDDSIKTACTNGYYIRYNQEFMDGLQNEEEHMFIICHEIFHVAFNHIERRKNKDAKLWNYVTDAVDNAHLMHDGLKIPLGGINIPWAYDYDAETLYDMLKKDYDLMKKFMEKIEKSIGDYLSENVDISHDSWDNCSSDNLSPEEKRRRENLCDAKEELTEIGEKKTFEENEKNVKENLNKLKKELADKSLGNNKGTSLVGNGPSTYIRDLGIIGKGKDKKIIDWRYLLVPNTTSYKMDWSYRNAEIEDGVLRPNLIKLPFADTEIVVDKSGSISNELLKSFLYECKSVMQLSKVKIGFFDTEFSGFTELRRLSDIDKLEITGGGGTDFDVAVNAFSRRVLNRIIFTDGEAYTPKNKLKVIWVVFGNKEIDPQGSKVIYVDENKLIKRYRDKVKVK